MQLVYKISPVWQILHLIICAWPISDLSREHNMNLLKMSFTCVVLTSLICLSVVVSSPTKNFKRSSEPLNAQQYLDEHNADRGATGSCDMNTLVRELLNHNRMKRTFPSQCDSQRLNFKRLKCLYQQIFTIGNRVYY